MKRNKLGQYASHKPFTILGIAWIVGMLTMIILGSQVKVEYEFISPIPADTFILKEVTITPTEKCDYADCWVRKYSVLFGGTHAEITRTKALVHYLLYRESGYGSNKSCGDGGKACGPLQFHKGTWEANRQRMIDAGIVSEIGDRTDMRQAIETTAWMIAQGQENQWGPYLRGDIKL